MIRSIAAAALLSLQACASHIPPDVSAVSEVLAQPYPALSSEINALQMAPGQRQLLLDDLLQQPLTPAHAQGIALLKSPAVAEALAELGIAQASAVQAGLISNPGFSISLLRPEDGGRWKLDAGISLSILDWFTRPLRGQLSAIALLQAQLQLAQSLDLELESVLHDYFAALAERERLLILRGNLEAARATDALAAAMFDAGNISELVRLQHAGEMQRRQAEVWAAESVAAEAVIMLRARLGLSAQETLLLPDNLPPFHGVTESTAQQLLEDARSRQPQMLLAEQQVLLSEQHLSLTDSYGAWVRVEPGLVFEREQDGTAQGVSLELGLPVFDQGQARLGEAQSRVAAARARQARELADLEARIASALNSLQSAAKRLQYLQQDVIPQHERMLILGLQEYNFMLADAFSLLQIKQAELDTRLSAVDALSDYWQAQALLAAAAGLPLETGMPGEAGSPVRDPSREAAESPTTDNPEPTAPQEHQHD